MGCEEDDEEPDGSPWTLGWEQEERETGKQAGEKGDRGGGRVFTKI